MLTEGTNLQKVSSNGVAYFDRDIYLKHLIEKNCKG